MLLALNRVSRRYAGNVWALRDITLSLEPGVIGLLGPNGAGKSTLLRLLATIIAPTEGQITWNGIDLSRQPDAVRRVLGYLPQDVGVYQHLSGVEFLTYMAAAKGLPTKGIRERIADLLTLVNLTNVARRPLASYSGGMRQRIGIAQALLNNPSILLLDEPTVGLDPEERVRFRHLLADIAKDRVVVLSTHIVSDIVAIADRVVVLHRGRLQSDGPPEGLLRLAEGRTWELIASEQEYGSLRDCWRISSAVRKTDGIHLRIVGEGSPPLHAHPVVPTLEDGYLQLIAGDRESDRT